MLKNLNTNNYEVIIISPRNYFLFTPLLPSATVGTVDQRSIVEHIHKYCKRTKSDSIFYEALCTDVDFQNKIIYCKDTTSITPGRIFSLNYDYLIIAVGSETNTFNTKGVKEYCYFLKEISDTFSIRNKIIDLFEAANIPGKSIIEQKNLLHFIIVGGGPTGVEFAAELHDFLQEDLIKWYPKLIDKVSISLIQSSEHILNTYDETLSKYTEQKFKRENINVITNSRVTEVNKDNLLILDKQKNLKDIPYGLCVWATGIAANPLIIQLCNKIPEQTNNKVLITDDFLRVKGVNDVFAIGDCSTIEQHKLLQEFLKLFEIADKNKDNVLSYEEFKNLIYSIQPNYPQLSIYSQKIKELFEECDINHDNILTRDEFKQALIKIDSNLKNLPATAQVASQQGKYLAKLFHSLQKEEKIYPFIYKHAGNLAYIGRQRAVAELKGHPFTGWLTCGFGNLFI
jgi:NADH dehydrogenase FAD-containing subunit